MALLLFKKAISANLTKLASGFNEHSETVALKIPMDRCSEFLMKLQEYLIKEEGVASVARESEQVDFNNRLLLLNKSIDLNLSQLPVDLREWVEAQKVEIKKFEIIKGLNTFSLEDAISKVLKVKNVDPHIKVETLKQFKIVELSQEQQSSKEEIAEIVLNKGGSGTSAVLQKVIQNNKHFLIYSYEHLVGDASAKLEFREGACQFSVLPTSVYINNYAQEERDKLLSSVKQNQTVIDLFGNLILDTRLCKESSASVKALLKSPELVQIFNDAYQQNSTQKRSQSRSLSQPAPTIPIKTGSLQCEVACVFEYLQKQYEDGESKLVIISEILKDIFFLCSFVGIGKTSVEGRVFFQLLVTEEDYGSKSISELIIDQLNAQTKILSNGEIQENLFNKTDILSVSASSIDNKNKLLSVDLNLSEQVLQHKKSLLSAVQNQFFSQKNIQPSQNLEEVEPSLEKKIKQ